MQFASLMNADRDGSWRFRACADRQVEPLSRYFSLANRKSRNEKKVAAEEKLLEADSLIEELGSISIAFLYSSTVPVRRGGGSHTSRFRMRLLVMRARLVFSFSLCQELKRKAIAPGAIVIPLLPSAARANARELPRKVASAFVIFPLHLYLALRSFRQGEGRGMIRRVCRARRVLARVEYAYVTTTRYAKRACCFSCRARINRYRAPGINAHLWLRGEFFFHRSTRKRGNGASAGTCRYCIKRIGLDFH